MGYKYMRKESYYNKSDVIIIFIISIFLSMALIGLILFVQLNENQPQINKLESIDEIKERLYSLNVEVDKIKEQLDKLNIEIDKSLLDR